MRPVVPAILVGLLLPFWSNSSFAVDPLVVPVLKELSPTPSDDPVSASPTRVEAGKYRFFAVTGYTGPADSLTWEVDGSSVAFKEVTKPLVLFGLIHGAKEPGEYDVPAQAIIVWGRSEGTTTVKALGIVNGKARTLFKKVFVVGKMPQPPPEPKPDDPEPKPPEPKPAVESFRVIIGFESGVVVPPNVISVAHGKVVEEWLTANCTGGKAGWRRRDQNLGSENDPKMASLWNAVKDAKPTPPFFAVEVNGKVEVIPFEKTPEAMVAKLNTYRGVK